MAMDDDRVHGSPEQSQVADLSEVRDMIGKSIRVRSRNQAIDNIIEEVRHDAFGDTEELNMAHYDKVFDRTQPGYDRSYDRN